MVETALSKPYVTCWVFPLTATAHFLHLSICILSRWKETLIRSCAAQRRHPIVWHCLPTCLENEHLQVSFFRKRPIGCWSCALVSFLFCGYVTIWQSFAPSTVRMTCDFVKDYRYEQVKKSHDKLQMHQDYHFWHRWHRPLCEHLVSGGARPPRNFLSSGFFLRHAFISTMFVWIGVPWKDIPWWPGTLVQQLSGVGRPINWVRLMKISIAMIVSAKCCVNGHFFLRSIYFEFSQECHFRTHAIWLEK